MSRPFRKGACVNIDTAGAVERFATAAPDRVHNPWPELADQSKYLEPYSQPLIRTWWVPLVKGGDLAALPLDYQAAALHENVHIQLDFTPANELARVILARAYEAVATLLALRGDVRDDDIAGLVGLVRRRSAELGVLAGRTELADELLATAWSLELLRSTRKGVGPRAAAEMDSITVRVTRGYRETIPGFGRYLPVIQQVLELVRASAVPVPQAMARLAIFLSPVRIGGRDPVAIPTRRRVRRVAEAVGGISNGPALMRWLDDEMRGSPEWSAWQAVLRLQVSLQGKLIAAGPLWVAARTRRPQTARSEAAAWALVRRTQERYWSWQGPMKRASMVMLVPQEDRGKWYVVAVADGAMERRLGLLAFEAVRQQLSARVGIRCPFLTYGACVCRTGNPTIRGSMQRLEQLALSGVFGEGDWTPMAEECTSTGR